MATKKNTSTTSASMVSMGTPNYSTSTPIYQPPMVVQKNLSPQEKYNIAIKKMLRDGGSINLTPEEEFLVSNPPELNPQLYPQTTTTPQTVDTSTLPSPTVTTTDTTGTTTTQPTTATVPVGTSANANQLMDYTNAIAAADAALGKAGIVNTLQLRKAQAAGDLATRTAERDIYYAKQNALNQLAQRGISGSPGLKVAAERAAIVAPTTQRLQAINTMKESQSAANLLLAEETARRQQAIQDANTALTKVTNLTNQLGGRP